MPEAVRIKPPLPGPEDERARALFGLCCALLLKLGRGVVFTREDFMNWPSNWNGCEIVAFRESDGGAIDLRLIEEVGKLGTRP